jgi:hypothetical protein
MGLSFIGLEKAGCGSGQGASFARRCAVLTKLFNPLKKKKKTELTTCYDCHVIVGKNKRDVDRSAATFFYFFWVGICVQLRGVLGVNFFFFNLFYRELA